MNERIDEFIGYAKFMAEETTKRQISLNTELRTFSKFFAELIVKECISALEEKIHRSIDHEGDEIWADLILKEHFGVEE